MVLINALACINNACIPGFKLLVVCELEMFMIRLLHSEVQWSCTVCTKVEYAMGGVNTKKHLAAAPPCWGLAEPTARYKSRVFNVGKLEENRLKRHTVMWRDIYMIIYIVACWTSSE